MGVKGKQYGGRGRGPREYVTILDADCNCPREAFPVGGTDATKVELSCPLHGHLRRSDFSPGDRVIYVPYHAHDDRTHPDCERGIVTSVNVPFVFVRFREGASSKACKRDQLQLEE